MLNTVRAIIREGRIELLEKVQVSEGTELLVTVLPQEEADFWVNASQSSLAQIWDNTENDVYAELLKA
ncbi:MAG: hypothetical protein NPIRA02_33330 [Nitrospirales bacterium]|nr:MAG: hypothetical protein NPIRA02_33330 [Nitrospirales bacterium]